MAEETGESAMSELSGTIHSTALSMDGKPLITFMVNEYRDCMKTVQELTGQPVSIKVTKQKKKRSLDSNAYFWILVDKLSQKMNLPKEDIYRNAIRNIGGVSEVVCVRNEAVEKLCSGWSSNGLGWQTDTMPSKIAGCTNVVLYYGSSTYNQEQMTRLIDNIVQDCKAVGIETLSPIELARLTG
jgi:hypothetical protein